MNWYLSTSAGPYAVGKQTVELASVDLMFSAVALSILGVVFIVSWGVSLVRRKPVEQTPESRFAEIREAIRRADEAPASEQERVETASRMVP